MGRALCAVCPRRIPWRTALRTLALCLTTSSCFTTNAYLVPDTLPPGRTTITPALDGWIFRRNYEVPDQTFPRRHVDSAGFALLPHVMGRVGVAPKVEAGIDFGPDSPLRGDVKVQVVEGDIGVAVAGIGRLTTTSNDPRTGHSGAGSFEIPVVVGFHVSSELTLVASPAFSWVLGRTATPPESFKRDEAWTRANYLQMALGPVLKANARMSLFPEVTFMHSISGPETNWITVGLGIVITPKQRP